MQRPPVGFFAHARSDYTRRSTACCDGARRDADSDRVAEIRRIAQVAAGPENFGVARMIIGGITDTMREFGRAIIS